MKIQIHTYIHTYITQRGEISTLIAFLATFPYILDKSNWKTVTA